ncbi:MAG: DNA-directed RNA polymerase subunit omega [Alphaproteobacteria bacterium]|nr:DNA-directed RNA polymerase subunit omega [Alphaproteobacteria bacterium]
MARTTISDTLEKMDSKYELGMLATQRVRDLNGGAEPVVHTGNDKPTVTALREIASGKLDVGHLRHEFVQSYKSVPVADDSETSVESQSEDPLLKELDAELEDAIVENPMPAEEEEDILEESLPEEGEAE